MVTKTVKVSGKSMEDSMDVEWQKAVNPEPEYIGECKGC